MLLPLSYIICWKSFFNSKPQYDVVIRGVQSQTPERFLQQRVHHTTLMTVAIVMIVSMRMPMRMSMRMSMPVIVRMSMPMVVIMIVVMSVVVTAQNE